jgi:hypothetical protein
MSLIFAFIGGLIVGAVMVAICRLSAFADLRSRHELLHNAYSKLIETFENLKAEQLKERRMK